MTMEPASLTPATWVARTGEILVNRMGEETVMLDVEQGRYFGLDDLGTDIWTRLAAPIQVGELCAGLSAVYAVDEATCLRDVTALLGQLREAGLLAVLPGRP